MNTLNAIATIAALANVAAGLVLIVLDAARSDRATYYDGPPARCTTASTAR
jgi:uncharacterized metal-binding protein